MNTDNTQLHSSASKNDQSQTVISYISVPTRSDKSHRGMFELLVILDSARSFLLAVMVASGRSSRLFSSGVT